MSDKPYISNSQLGMYERCAESYRRRYIEGERLAPGIALPVGSGVHAGAGKNFEQKIESHKDMSRSNIVDCSVAGFEERIESDGIELTADEKTVGKKKVIGQAKDKVVRLSELYADETAPEYQPIMCEKKQRVVLPGEYDLLAVMDLADDKGNVIDLKTSKRSKTQKDVDNSEQLSFYALVYKAQFGKLPNSVRLECLVDTKTPKRQMLESKRVDADLQVLVKRINTMINGIEKGVFMPCDKSSWICSQNWCGFYSTCPYINNK